MSLVERESQIEQTAHQVYEGLEKPNWAPWLRFDEKELAEHRKVFPEGQITMYDEAGNPTASLDTVRVDWDGQENTLTSWDEVAGTDRGFADSHKPNGNTIALLSMSIRPDKKGERLSTKVIDELKSRFSGEETEHIIGAFRPSGFGEYKKITGNTSFEDYVSQKREDGLPVDGWLRALTRQGVDILKIDKKSMVVESTVSELASYYSTYKPEKWWQVTDPDEINTLVEWHSPTEQIENIDEVWECGETGTWYVDRENGKAVYIESNIWGQVPIEKKSKDTEPDYHLEKETLNELESDLVSQVKERFKGKENIYGAWIDNSHPYANIVRTLEASTPEFKGIEQVITNEVEARSRFYVLVDTRDGEDRIIHATRISGAPFDESGELSGQEDEGTTGFAAIDELVDSDQNFTLEDFKKYAEGKNINLDTCVCVETNFTVGKRSETDIPGVRVSDLGYTAIFNLLERKGLEPNKTSVFAFVNGNTKHSLGTVLGIDFEPFADRADLMVPGVEGDFDQDFWPVRIPITDKVVDIFTQLQQVAAPEVYFK